MSGVHAVELPALLELPEADGQIEVQACGQCFDIDAYRASTMHQYAKAYATEACARVSAELAAAREELAALRRDAETERALQRAAEVLPVGWELSVVVERDAGWVTLHNPDGDLMERDDDHDTLAQSINSAIDAAMQESHDHE